jgi:hypothetical protein
MLDRGRRMHMRTRVELPLCDRCVADALDHLGGVAASRGCAWSQSLSRVIPLDRQRPEKTTERMRAIARRKIGDLDSRDERLRELLAERCIDGALSWWNNVLRKGR